MLGLGVTMEIGKGNQAMSFSYFLIHFLLHLLLIDVTMEESSFVMHNVRFEQNQKPSQRRYTLYKFMFLIQFRMESW